MERWSCEPGPDQLGVAVFDVIALEQRLRHIKHLAADALGGLDKERVGGIAQQNSWAASS